MKRNISVKNRNFTIKWVIAILLSLSLILPNTGSVLATTDNAGNTEAPMFTALNTGETLPAIESIPEEKTYTIELEKYGIKNDGTDPESTSTGINNALKAVSTAVYEKIIFPQGTYLISENTPILISLKNMVIDLNGSTLQINTNGKTSYSVVQFIYGAENCTFTNGIIKGDSETHNYGTNPNAHTGCVGISLTSTYQGWPKNIKIDNITLTYLAGYGLQVSKCENITFTNNKFINNKNDLSVMAGSNLVFDGNVLTYEPSPGARTAVRILKAATDFTFTNNKVSKGNVIYELGEEGRCVISGNEYNNINVISPKPFSDLQITLTGETFFNSTVRPNDNVTITKRIKLVDCVLKREQTIINSVWNTDMEGCTITGPIGDMRNVNFKNCTISAATMRLFGQKTFEGSTISDSAFTALTDATSTNTNINLNGCTISNSQIQYIASSANPCDVTVESCDITMKERPVMQLSSKTNSLTFKNNAVKNQGAQPVIQVYADLAATTVCNVVIEENAFTLENSKYVFDGVNITKGILSYTGKNNTVNGAAEMLNPKYIGNPYFEISERDLATPKTITFTARPDTVKLNVPVTITVNLKDKANDNMSGEQIDWSVMSGSGTFSSNSSDTDAQGNATVEFTPTEVTTSGAVTVQAAVYRAPSVNSTIDLTGDVILSINPVTVITEAGMAPVLPSQVTAIYPNNIFKLVDVEWDSIAPGAYAEKGSFKVNGTVADTEIKAVANVRVTAVNTSATTLTGPDTVTNGQQLELIYGLIGVEGVLEEGILKQDISISYDKSKFEFVSAESVIAGTAISQETYKPEEGTIRLLLTSTTAISSNSDVAKLSFKAKASGTGVISVTSTELSDGEDTVSAALSSKTITVNATKSELSAAIASAKEVLNNAVEGIETGMYPEGTKARLNSAIEKAEASSSNIPSGAIAKAIEELNLAVNLFKGYVITAKTGDFNRILGLDIGDLGMVSSNYGMKAGDEGWNAIKRADINGDGEIGLFELTFIAKKLLGN